MSFIDYLKDTRAELRHVAWPTQAQTIVFTSLVVAISIFISLYLGFFDYIFTGILERVVVGNNGAEVIPPPEASTSPITITPTAAPTSTPNPNGPQFKVQ